MIDPRLLKQSLIAFGGVYLLSFLGHQEPLIATLSFFLIIGLTAYATFQKPFWGILILTAELLIGSQGHLFDITLLDFRVSLRMGIFLMVALVATLHAIKNHSFKTLFLMPHRTLYLLLGFFVLFSIGGGIWRGNSLSFLYQDANAYLFFLLVPFYHRALSHQATEKIKQLLTIWMSGIVFQAVLTLSLLFLYGHVDFFWKMLIPLYAWLRDLRLMEIGLFRLNVYRIFMQSQLWSLTGFFAFLSIWLATPREGRKSSIVSLLFKPHAALSAILIGALTVLITSLSRSFWIGAVAAFVIMILHFLYTTRPSIRQISTHALHLSIILFFSLLMMTIALIFPLGSVPGISSLASLRERATDTTDVAISSRWKLLPQLVKEIKQHPFTGNGFGATVTYETDDPRYREAHPNNPLYTTFAFEWGWLDIWHEMGLGGLVIYVTLLITLITQAFKSKMPLVRGLGAGVIALGIVHFFTPFLNHPLGIGFLLLTDALSYYFKEA